MIKELVKTPRQIKKLERLAESLVWQLSEDVWEGVDKILNGYSEETKSRIDEFVWAQIQDKMKD